MLYPIQLNRKSNEYGQGNNTTLITQSEVKKFQFA